MCGVAFIYGSYERVIEPAVPDGNKQADQQQRCAKSQGGKIPLGSWTGVPDQADEMPTQDQDDL